MATSALARGDKGKGRQRGGAVLVHDNDTDPIGCRRRTTADAPITLGASPARQDVRT